MEIKTKVQFISYDDYLHGKISVYWRGDELTLAIARQKLISIWPEPREEWHLVVEENPNKKDVSGIDALNANWAYILTEDVNEDWIWFSAQDNTSFCKTTKTYTNRVDSFKGEPVAVMVDIPCLFAHVVY